MKIFLFSKLVMHGAGLSHAKKDGGVCLRDAPWWRDVNGVWFTTRKTVVFVTFRRNPSYYRGRFVIDGRKRSR